MDVVVVLAGIVEEALVLAVAFLDDLFEGLSFEAGAFQQLVAVGDIGLMVLVVMKFKRLARHERRKGVIVIRQGGQFESHWKLSSFLQLIWAARGWPSRCCHKTCVRNLHRPHRCGRQWRH